MSSVVLQTHPDGAAPRRRLIPDQLLFTQAGRPERTEAAVRGAGDWVLPYARARGEEPGDEVVGWIGGRGSDDDPAGAEPGQRGQIRGERAHARLGLELH
jgi:hypothetical protein